MIDVIPAIFEKDWTEIERKIGLVAAHVDWVQIDVADGSLVPAETFCDFPRFLQLPQSLSLEAHLMVAQPEKYIRPLVDAGFKRIIAQVEANDPRLFLDEVVREGVEAGLAIDGTTPTEEIEPYLEEIDVVLVMLADAGTNEQSVAPENIEKVRAIHHHYPDLPIAVEEGINEKTVNVLREAGATRFVPTPEVAFVLVKREAQG